MMTTKLLKTNLMQMEKARQYNSTIKQAQYMIMMTMKTWKTNIFKKNNKIWIYCNN